MTTIQNNNGDRGCGASPQDSMYPKGNHKVYSQGNRPNYQDPNSISLNQIEMISILIVDDSEMIREGLKLLLQCEADLEIVAMADNGKTAIELIEKLQPDIALIDVEMPELDGIDTTRIIKQRFPQTKVIVFSSHDNDDYCIKSIEAGAKSYLAQQTEIAEICKTIRSVNKGYIQLESQLFEPLLAAIISAKSEAILTNNHDTVEDQESALAAFNDNSEIVNYEEEQILIPHKPAKSRLFWWMTVVSTVLTIITLVIAKLLPSLSAQFNSPPPPPHKGRFFTKR
jgi:DNA-binding NarL/FixJ family response regulator